MRSCLAARAAPSRVLRQRVDQFVLGTPRHATAHRQQVRSFSQQRHERHQRGGRTTGGTPPPPMGRSEQNSLLKLLDLTPEEAYPLDPVLLKQRYYELAKKLHPDVQAIGARDQHTQPWMRFAELTEGFERLIRHAQSLQADEQRRHDDAAEGSAGAAGDEPAAMGRAPRRGTMAATRAQQQAVSSTSCTNALRDRLGKGATELHALADEIEEQGPQASLGIDGPQGAFAVWWLSRDLQSVRPARTRTAPRGGRNRSRTRKPARLGE